MQDEKKQIGIIGLNEKGEIAGGDPIYMNLSVFRNSKYLDIRKYYNNDEKWLPTKKGIALNFDQFEELLKIIKNNENEIRGWFNNGK